MQRRFSVLIMFFIMLSLARAVDAQPRYLSVTVDTQSMTYGSARINWKLMEVSTSTIAHIQYGTNKLNLDYKSGDRSGGSGVDRGAWLGALQPNTRYYFRPVTADSSGTLNKDWGCTSTSSVKEGTVVGAVCLAAGEPPSFVTPPYPGDAALEPELPRISVDTNTVPLPTTTYPVITKCSDLPAALTRAVKDSAFSVPAIDLDENLRCKDVVLPKKTTTNRIVIRVKNADAVLPAPGQRIAEPGSVQAPKLPQFTSSGWESQSNASIRTFTSCAYGNKNCAPQTVCGAAYCSQGWYFLGIDFTTQDPLPVDPVKPLSVTGARADGRILKITIAGGHLLNANDVVLLDQFGGFNQTISGMYNVFAANASEIWVQFPTNLTGTWDGTGRAIHYVAQKIQTITCDAGSDCVVDVGSGNIHGLQTNTLVTPYLVRGLTGLSGPERVSDSYRITRIDNQTFRLNGTAGKVFGNHVTGTGFYFIDHSSVSLGRFQPDTADIIVDRSWIRNKFPHRATGMSLHGTREAIINSHVEVSSWVPIDPATGTPATQLRSILQLTPVAIDCSSGEGKKIENNLIRGHGILVFCQESPESEPGAPMAADVTVVRNTFHVPPALNTSTEAARDIYPRVHFHHRHSFELKRGTRMLLEGNVFEGGMSGEQLNQPMIGLTPRHNKTQDLVTNYISDITIRNNIFRFGVMVMAITGSDFNGNVISPINTRRILFENNVVYGMDWIKNRTKPSGQNASSPNLPSSPIGGTVFQLSWGPQDLFFRKNTIFDSRGTGPSLLDVSGRVTGLRFEDNLITYHRSTFGYDLFVAHPSTSNFAPDVVQPSVSTNAKFFADTTGGTGRFQNVLIRGTKNATGVCHGDSSAACNIGEQECTTRMGANSTFSATCFGTGSTAISRFDELGFWNWPKWDLRRRWDSKVPLTTGADVTAVINRCFKDIINANEISFAPFPASSPIGGEPRLANVSGALITEPTLVVPDQTTVNPSGESGPFDSADSITFQ